MRTISQIPVSFALQSYFSSTLWEKAILTQPANQMIVPSTQRVSQGEGYIVGVAGFSDAPVAFKFANAATVVCRPGQSFSPGRFTGFEYGLPFGWLGGGRAVIYVGHAPDAKLDLGAAKPEMIFHRSRFAIEASGGPLPTLKRNWPLHFPWSQAVRGANSADQRGNPILRVEPTRALMRLRISIAVDTAVQLVFRGSREFDEDDDGVVTPGQNTVALCEVTFKASSDIANYPMAVIPEDFLRLACDEGGLTILNLGDATLTDEEIDIARLGRI